MHIKIANKEEIPVLTDLALKLWPDHDREGMRADLAAIMEKDDAVFFLALDADVFVGFAQCQLRHDYVEGTDSSPVGYLEGIYVDEDHRHKGIAKALLGACEDWAKGKGCREFASDCELENAGSLRFHLNMGFQEANRIICFTKRI